MRETEGESTAATAQVTPSLDLIFDLLSNRRRRYALYYLSNQPDGVATLEDVTNGVVDHQERLSESTGETATTVEPDSEQRGQIQMELQHTHLPKLEDAGILEHDQRSETVRYWTQPSLEEWLEHAHHKESH
ncbi:DUF7344 domain-containing protein [Natronorubrum aibiense]|uniref:DUF7344 domain-containing protein n=1 Tax=Natronorubrum aibiense TaxID=348826 RepID=A0A5P9NYX7_9EURY|nr:hypothetical protein [Natronorubrum aibiense]QFU81093.1 hypothetical protein GCU68_00250 [Natronorubrum aibiense]